LLFGFFNCFVYFGAARENRRMRTGDYEIIILNENNKPYYERFLNGQWIIEPNRGESFKVVIKLYTDYLIGSQYYLLDLSIDGKRIDSAKQVQCFPKTPYGAAKFPQVQGTFPFQFSGPAKHSSPSQPFGTISVAIHEGYYTNRFLYGGNSSETESKLMFQWYYGKPLQVLTIHYRNKPERRFFSAPDRRLCWADQERAVDQMLESSQEENASQRFKRDEGRPLMIDLTQDFPIRTQDI
jgi:hypothetical protein